LIPGRPVRPFRFRAYATGDPASGPPFAFPSGAGTREGGKPSAEGPQFTLMLMPEKLPLIVTVLGGVSLSWKVPEKLPSMYQSSAGPTFW
jgi:hypothetical protein